LIQGEGANQHTQQIVFRGLHCFVEAERKLGWVQKELHHWIIISLNRWLMHLVKLVLAHKLQRAKELLLPS